MFAKPYKLKSTNTLKNSEKKLLVQRVLDTFPAATEAQVRELVPIKGNANWLRLLLHANGSVDVFVVDNRPVLLDTEAGLVPTVYALWKMPDLLPTIVIQTPVLGKMLGGAPLYLPGVVMQRQGVGFPMFAKGALIAACTADNKAAAVVGRAAMGSVDMLLKATGACLETIHVFGDQLCREPKFDKSERPQWGPPLAAPAPAPTPAPAPAGTVAPGGKQPEALTNSLSELSLKPAREEWPALGRGHSAPNTAISPAPVPAPVPAPAPPPPNQPRLIADGQAGETELDDSLPPDGADAEEEECSIPSDMDGLLRWALLSFMRLEGKHVELPLKTNLLYKNHLFPLCPLDRTLDVKKSSYKKMSKFLEAMQREGFLEVQEIEKGVDAVTALHTAHPLARAHSVPPALRARLARGREGKEGREGGELDYKPPEVREMLCVTAAVAPLFRGVKKGTPLTAAEVRAALTEYVKSRGLAAPERKGAVLLDAALAGVLGAREQECIKWDALMAGVAGRMTPATELRWADGSDKLIKSRLEPITMQVVTRSGNKKVTLVSNLEAYGFHLPSLSRTSQQGAGAAAGVTRAPGARADQLMLQGDQTHFVAKLLIEKYGVPKKFLEGADKALNKKK